MKKIVFLTMMLCTVLFSFNANAQLDYIQKGKVDKLFKTTNTVYFKFPVHSMSEIPQLGKVISVDKSKGNQVFAHANKQQFSTFIKMNYNYTVIPSPQSKKPATAAKKGTATKKPAAKATTTKPVKK